MRNRIIILMSVVAIVIGIGFVLPQFFLKNNPHITVANTNCAILETKIMLDNPLQRLLTLGIIVIGGDGNKIYTTAYTVFGIKYVTLEVGCEAR